MTKLELIHQISARIPGTTLTSINSFLDALAGVVKDSLLDGKSVKVPGLAKFETVDKPACTRRNPQTGATIHVPARKDVKTITAKSLRKSVVCR